MTKLKIYAIVIARFIVIFVGYLFAAPTFVLTILGHIGELYHSALFAFVQQTKTLIANYDKVLSNNK